MLCCVYAEKERRVKANAPDYNDKFLYAVSRSQGDATFSFLPFSFMSLSLCDSAGQSHQNFQVQCPHLPAPQPVRAVPESGQRILCGATYTAGTGSSHVYMTYRGPRMAEWSI